MILFKRKQTILIRMKYFRKKKYKMRILVMINQHHPTEWKYVIPKIVAGMIFRERI